MNIEKITYLKIINLIIKVNIEVRNVIEKNNEIKKFEIVIVNKFISKLILLKC